MGDEKRIETYPNQFSEWTDGCFVVGDTYQDPNLGEARSAIIANLAIAEAMDSSDD